MPRNAKTAKAKTRTRSGCLRCRSRRRKCDGTHPRCRNCESRGYTCQWGLKVSFHRSRNFSLSQDEAVALMEVEEGRPCRSSVIVDETGEVIRSYTGADKEEQPDTNMPILSPDLSQSAPSAASPSPIDLNLILPSTGPSDPYIPPFSLGQAISKTASPPPSPSPSPVSELQKAHLISSYLEETGTWCETTDSDRQFTIHSVRAMMESPAFVAAAMSLASRQLDHINRRHRPVTLELYQYVIQLLIRQDPVEADASVLATCTLLCVYEMMASSVEEWRRHLQGCAGLLRAKKWNGSSAGIVKSCFWAFARIDVWAAFTSGKTTLIPTDFWVDDQSIGSASARGNIDDYCNLAILIFAEIVNVLATHQGTSARLKLWEQLQEWRRLRPKEAYPLLTSSTTLSTPFPSVVYTTSSAICGNTFYHTGCILLLQTGINDSIKDETDDPIWHAREVTGISMSNTSHANWVNQLQPLYLAGTLFTKTDSSDILEEYAAEKILLLKHLTRIERETGWKTSDRAGELRGLWGFE
ncbi:hypothetical protein ASPWEDRAFT_172784 [Aspergillus wentii DTO 134E9]|uniref:Zn(2)-C6 fungal-type domain-containing protein n=1 Tax=Aspergillus wentii DTO 134E9 TaxID=1073089 RepID=A0A1L9RM18_ASPWE|nr:uncharacterized protein ASPWEDRAFT_172784 [Aspergillus wentii DTO 134E9]KAI9929559.1 hypothetical protein MW887_001032 [Aspergillus wentii]OJJ36000.1 hypothetical protein ASPWEDRAFT_172784 [Aspergillus wentii DTO 134E9]